jgi:hypothetical protein
MALAEGLIGGAQIGEADLSASPKGTVALVDANGSFDLGNFDIFDIIDLPVRSVFVLVVDRLLTSTALPGSCSPRRSRGHARPSRLPQGGEPLAREDRDPVQPSEGLGGVLRYHRHVFFPAGVPFEIPTESMGREFCSTSSCLFNAHTTLQSTTSTLACGKFVQYVSCVHLLHYNLTLLASSSGLVGAEVKAAGRSRAREQSLTSCQEEWGVASGFTPAVRWTFRSGRGTHRGSLGG